MWILVAYITLGFIIAEACYRKGLMINFSYLGTTIILVYSMIIVFWLPILIIIFIKRFLNRLV